jgi:putative restriction endonuclease
MELDDRYLLTRYKHDGLEGVLFKVSWQQTEPTRQRKYTSKLFAFKDYPDENAAIQAALQYRDEWLINNPAVQLQKGREDRFFLSPPSNNTSGILGVNRTFDKLASGKKSYFWQAAWRDSNGKSINKSFSVNRLGEDQALKAAVTARRDALLGMSDSLSEGEQSLIDYYNDIISNIEQFIGDRGISLAELASAPNVGATEKFESIKIRIGQQKFRREVLDYFNHACAITQSKVLVRASHIKPWAVCSGEERLNPANGLALSPAYDAAFDGGLISFNDRGEIIIDKHLKLDLELLGINGLEVLKDLSDEHKLFLAWHRNNIFKNARIGSENA